MVLQPATEPERATYCVYCGNSLAGADHGRPTCRASCLTKLKGFVKRLATATRDMLRNEGELNQEDPGVSQLRHFKGDWFALVARKPALAPECSIHQIGDDLLAAVLPQMIASDGTDCPIRLDGKLYGKLVQNGWVKLDEKLYWGLKAREAPGQPTKPAPPWERNRTRGIPGETTSSEA